MNYIKEIIEKDNSTLEELINCFELVKENGDIAIIKFDGERKENVYTVFISFPPIKEREMIRADESNLRKALLKVLAVYIKE